MSGPCGRTSVPIIREVEEISTVNMVKTIKKIYPSCVILVKVGNFYHVYGKDAYIFSYLFEYKILEKEGVPSCGFPINAISKVENILERTKINYVSVDRRNISTYFIISKVTRLFKSSTKLKLQFRHLSLNKHECLNCNLYS